MTERERCEQFWTALLARDGETVSWARDKKGEYAAPFARRVWAAWQSASEHAAWKITKLETQLNQLKKIDSHDHANPAAYASAMRKTIAAITHDTTTVVATLLPEKGAYNLTKPRDCKAMPTSDGRVFCDRCHTWWGEGGIAPASLFACQQVQK